MLIEIRGAVPGAGEGTHDDRADPAPPVRIVVHPLVPRNDQDAVGLKLRARDQRADVILRPCIGLAERAVMAVVDQVRRNVPDLREPVVGDVGGKGTAVVPIKITLP